jgi:hypothetical protein
MITVTNNSSAQVDNAVISTNIPGEIFSVGNLQIAGTPVSGDIVSGVNVGSIPQSVTKAITFEGKTQNAIVSSAKQGVATITASGATQSDAVSINFNSNQSVAAVAGASTTSGFWEFLKKWYIWMAVGLVLILLFIVIFKRLSSEV